MIMPPRREKSGGRIALEVIGIGLMVLSGGCSLLVLGSGGLGAFSTVLVFGGIPFAVGLLIHRAGSWIDR